LRCDPYALFLALRRDAPRSVLLDAPPGAGRWAFMAAGDLQVVEARREGFQAVDRALGPARARAPSLPPFAGGFVGLLGYDLARELERLPARAPDVLGLPTVRGFLLDEVLACDTEARVVHAVAAPRPGETAKEVEARAADLLARAQGSLRVPEGREAGGVAASDAGARGYQRMVRDAKELIAAGHTYQVNLAHRLSWRSTADPLWLHQRLRGLNPSPFAFYLDSGDWQLVSCSPERLLRVRGRDVETRPIAGTYPRAGAAEEEAQAARLRADPKERAEHTMLVDLERNDLGRVCDFGSVRVAEFMATERYSHVVHLVSSVVGRLRPGATSMGAVRACFPGGTITGVPKVRAMEIIEALEPSRRGFYTGSVGWIGFDGDADLNIVIRTMLCKDGQVHAPVGAGIVADSHPEREWRETLHKARAMLVAAGVEAP
jgi:anthranilate/para-aminobenzoate synthase component I